MNVAGPVTQDLCNEVHSQGAKCSLPTGHRGPHWGHAPHISWHQSVAEEEVREIVRSMLVEAGLIEGSAEDE